MCNLCSTKPVYEFTNKRKLCARCFINYFQKKILYTIRKFGMIKNGDAVGYFPSGGFRDAVLEDVLKMFAKKANVNLVKLHKLSTTPTTTPKYSLVNSPRLIKKFANGETEFSLDINNFKKSRTSKASEQFNRAQQGQFKIAISSTLDSESKEIIQTLIKGKEKDLKEFKPVYGKIIKPLYLFSDKEVLLYAKLHVLCFDFCHYAKLRKLKFRKTESRKDKISEFLDGLEEKHPEVKRAIVNGYLELYN